MAYIVGAHYFRHFTNLFFFFFSSGQIFDLGLQHKYYNDPVMIQKHIDELAEKIDLVLIMEYFDESLVLLKRELCWELDDVVYFKLNQRSKEYKQANITDQQQVKMTLSALFNFKPHCLFAYLVSVPTRGSNQYLIQVISHNWNLTFESKISQLVLNEVLRGDI